MASQSRHINFDWETLLGPDERFATKDASLARLDGVGGGCGVDDERFPTTTNSSRSTGIASVSKVSSSVGAANDDDDANDDDGGRGGEKSNKRQTKRGYDRKSHYRSSSPLGMNYD